MTFQEVTKMMLNSMDFFELRRTAARYAIPYQGVRRQKLVRDLEKAILAKGNPRQALQNDALQTSSVASSSPEGAVSAKPKLTETQKPVSSGARINTFSTRSIIPRARA